MLRFIIALLLLPVAATAQDRRPSHCIAIADAAPGLSYIHHAAYRAPLPDDYTVRLNYVDHAMFLLETPAGVTAVTDFVGFIGATRLIPDVVTMNRAHDSHFTPYPDPAIPHVLNGWGTKDVAADHHLEVRDLLVRNVPTDIRGRLGGGVIPNGNSIFVFEVGGLCIGHLGHLHHEPDDAQYAALGRLDVVMAPVDGGLTLDLPTMIRTLKRLRSSVVLPMHWFGPASLETFLLGMSDDFVIQRADASHLEVSLRSLPSTPTVIVLRPSFLSDPVAQP